MLYGRGPVAAAMLLGKTSEIDAGLLLVVVWHDVNPRRPRAAGKGRCGRGRGEEREAGKISEETQHRL